MSNTALKIKITVNDDGSVKLQKFGKNAAIAGLKGSNAFKKTGKSLDAMNKKSVIAAKHVMALAATFLSLGALYLAFRQITRSLGEYVALSKVQEDAEKRLTAVLTATGFAARFNIEQLKVMASAMQAITTTGDEVILNGMAILATFKNIRGEAFERTTMAAMDMSAVMGQDLKSSMVMIAKAMNDPIANLSAMSRAGVQFTQDQKDMIKQLWESGDQMEAQNIILKEMETQFGGTAAAMRLTFSGAAAAAGNALGDVKEEIGFIITKNEVFIELMREVETTFISWGEAIKDNKEELMDFSKSGIVALVSGMETAVLAGGYLIKTMQGMSMEWLVMKKAFLSVDVLAQKFKVWANEGEVSEKKLRMELEATTSAYNDVVHAISTLEQANVDTEEAVFKIHAALGKFKKTIIETDAETKVLSATTKEWNAIIGEIEMHLGAISGAGGGLPKLTKEQKKANEEYKKFMEYLDGINWMDWVVGIDNATTKLAAFREEMSRMGNLEVDPADDLFGGYGDSDMTDAIRRMGDDSAYAKDIIDQLNESLAESGSIFETSIFGDAANQNIQNVMKSLEELHDVFGKIQDREIFIAEMRAKANFIDDRNKQAEAYEAASKLETKYAEKAIQAQLGGYRQLFGTTKDLFEENTKERETMHRMEQAFAIAEIAMSMQKSIAVVTAYMAQSAASKAAAVEGAVASIAAQGTVPVAGFAMVGAMMALMAGVLAMGGIAFSGGGGAESVSPVSLPDSTVLGADPGTASESIKNTYDLLEDNHAEEYGALLDIYNEIQDLNQNITALVTGVIKGISGFDSSMSLESSIGAGEKFHEALSGVLYEIYDITKMAMGTFLTPISDFISDFVVDLIGDVTSYILGGDVRYELLTVGLTQRGGAGSFAELFGGKDVGIEGYAWMEKITAGGLFGDDDYDKFTEYFDLEDEFVHLMSEVFRNIGEAMLEISTGLGFGADKVQEIMDYAITFTNISDIEDMSDTQIADAINNYFTRFADTMAGDLFGELIKKYQKVDEGLFETAVRLVVEKEIILEVLAMTGQEFNGTAQEAVHFSQALIEVAGDLGKLTEAAETYFEQYYTDAEKLAWLNGNLARSFEAIGVALPSDRDGFKALMAGIDQTTDSGMELYVALLNIAGATDSYYDALEAANRKISDAQRELTGTTEQGSIDDISARYGWLINEDTAFDFIKAFIAATPTEIEAYAAAMGVTSEQLVDDIMTLADIFGYLDDAVEQAATDFAALRDQIDSLLSGVSGSFGGADSASMIMSQITGMQSIPMSEMSGDNLLAMSEKLVQWYNAAVSEAQNAARAEQETARLFEQVNDRVSSLVSQIDSTIMSIKTSPLNVALPAQIAQEIAVDYEAAYAAAKAGGTAEIQEYLSIAQTHLGTFQAVHKSDQDYQDEYARVMAHMEEIKAKAEAGGYDEQILAELQSGHETIDVDLTAIQAQFSNIEGWIVNALGTLENLQMIITIDWENWSGDQVDALEMLTALIDVYGPNHEYTLKFLAEVPLDIFENVDELATAAGWIADNLGGWNSKAEIIFLKNVAANWDWENLDQILAAVGWVKTQAGSWTADATISFIAELMDRFDQPITAIDYWLSQMGISNAEVSRSVKINLIYEMVSSGSLNLAEVAEYAYNQSYAAWLMDPRMAEAISILQDMQGLAGMWGITDALTLGANVNAHGGYISDPQSWADLWSRHGMDPAGWMYGGMAYGPETGHVATLHGNELIVSPKAPYPATVISNGGSTRAGVSRDEEIFLLREQIRLLAEIAAQNGRPIELGGQPLERFVDKRADNIRRIGERRHVGTGRIIL